MRFHGLLPLIAGVVFLGCGRAQAGGSALASVPAAPASVVVAKPESEPPPVEAIDLTEAALIASGYEKSPARQRAREILERWVGPLVRSLSEISDESTRAERLLAELHRKGGLLGRYDMRATTLQDILANRHYNCVSASVLYNLVAHRLGLAVGAQLLPTHARSLLSANRGDRLERIVIETTSEHGFDPSPEEEDAVLAQVAAARAPGGRSLVSDEGAVVSSLVLVSTMYVNRASIAQERGDYEVAERLFARGERLVADGEMGRLLREQRIALLSQLAADDLMSEDPSRFGRAYRTLLAAAGLGPKDREIQAVLHHNLRAAAERVVSAQLEAGGEKKAWSVVEEASALLPVEHRHGLRAFAWSEVGRVRVEAQRYEAAVKAYDRGIARCAPIPDDPLGATLIKNRVAALRLGAFHVAKRGRYRRGWSLLERAAETPGIRRSDRQLLEKDAARVIHLAAGFHIEAADFESALRTYRAGLKRFPNDETMRHNLIAVLERKIGNLTDAKACGQVEGELRELEAVDRGSDFARQTRVLCLLEQAKGRLEVKDYRRARALIEDAIVLEPKDQRLRRNLAVTLASWTRALARRGSCSRAQVLASELEELAVPDVGRSAVERSLSRCAGRR